MLTAGERLIVDPFLRELQAWDLREWSPELHVISRRMLLCEVVLADVEPDDLLRVAVRGLASAALDTCLWPRDLAVLRRNLAARRGYLQALLSAR